MDTSKRHSFTLRGRDGHDHAYTAQLHPGLEGASIHFRLASLGLEPLGRILQQALGMEELLAALEGDKDAEDMPLAQLLAKARGTMDLAAVGSDLRAALRGDVDMVAMTRDILAFTTRDGKKLSQELHFSAAYRGNYTEMDLALWRVVQLNGFLPLPAGKQSEP